MQIAREMQKDAKPTVSRGVRSTHANACGRFRLTDAENDGPDGSDADFALRTSTIASTTQNQQISQYVEWIKSHLLVPVEHLRLAVTDGEDATMSRAMRKPWP
jgi:hypothetical protein